MENAKHRNGVRHLPVIKERAREMRWRGMTHREIRDILGISLGSAELWTRGIPLSVAQKEAIIMRRSAKVFTAEWRKRRSEWAKEHMRHPKRYSDNDLLQKIRSFHVAHNRIPLKREFNALRIYRERFGSWNNAIRLAGFEPNPVLFSRKFTAIDGHMCDSFSEKVIDDWLFMRDVRHERAVPYPGTRMTADFSLPGGVFMEFFGLAGEQKKYDALVKRKRRFCREQGIALVEIYPTDLFPISRLEARLGRVISLPPSPSPRDASSPRASLLSEGN